MDNNEIKDSNEIKDKYLELLDLVLENNIDESIKEKIIKFKDNISKEFDNCMIENFANKIEKSKKVKKLFLNRNIKLFNEKNRIKIIPSLDLKSFISNLNDETEKKLWDYLQIIYAIHRSGIDDHKLYINSIISKIDFKSKKSNNTDNIILDIADSLRDSFKNLSNNKNSNPMDNIFKTSQKIAEKYSSQIKNGELNMQDMFSSLTNMMGKIESDTKSDSNIQNIDLGNLPKPEELLNSLGLNDLNPAQLMSDLQNNKFNPMDMIGKMMGNKEKLNDKLSPDQIKEMEDFYSDFKSEDFEKIKDIKIKDNKSPDLGNLAKNMLGSLGGVKGVGDLMGNLFKK